MAELSPVALLPGGCQQDCALPVISHANVIVYCSAAAIYMHTPNTITLPASAGAAVGTGRAKNENETFHNYPLTRIFASGVVGVIYSFDFNDEYMACVTSTTNTVVWRIADGENLNDKRVPSCVGEFFRREGGPSVVRIAGKYHILYGTKTGWVVSVNMNDGTTMHQLRLCVTYKSVNSISLSTPASVATKAAGGHWEGTETQVGYVTVVDVSISRPDTIVVGTSEGYLFVLSIHPANGLRQTASLRPFSAPAVFEDKPAADSTNNGSDALNEMGCLPVTAMAFDPNNPNFVAVGSRDGGLVLVDIVSTTIVQTYAVNGEPVISIAWLAGQAGEFVTTDGESSKLHVWSVSTRTAVAVWHPVAGCAIFGIAAFAPEHLFIALRSGSVAVFNTRTGQIEMQTEAGHTDVMHTCRYAHHDKDQLATTSTDGTIRLWNTKQLVLQNTLDVGRVIVRSMDWSLSGKYLAAGLSNGEVVCYYVHTQREHWRVSVTTVSTVYFVSWSCTESGGHIAASHRDGLAVISARDGKILRHYKTKSPVSGIEFDRKHPKHLAAACQDGQVLVFHISSSREEPALILTGHMDAASSVSYNPTVPNFLLSCSHDTTLRLWDLYSGASHTASVSCRVLRGHTNSVNAIAWCSIAPYIALSASSDCTVRLWDVRGGSNLATVRAHNAEVIALSTHPERPLVFASVSHDNSIIFWHLGLLRQVYLEAALGRIEHCIVSDGASLLASAAASSSSSIVDPAFLVTGDVVQELNKELKEANLAPHKRMERLVRMFEFPCGAVDLARAAGFSVDPQDVSNAKCTVVPTSRLVEVHGKWGKTNVEKSHGKTVTNAGEEYKKSRIIEAAEFMLQIGKVAEYCQLMAEVGEWDRAIAAAPVVSRDFWRSLCLKAAETMEAAGNARALRYFIMAEESARAALLVSRQSNKNWDLAAVIAQTCPQHVVDETSTEPPHNTTVDTNGVSAVVKGLLNARATALENAMNPRIVAATKLAEGANDDAVMDLIHSGDVVIAHLLVHTVPLQRQTTIDAGYRLSMLLSCRQRQWDTALICATRHSNPHDGLATVLAFYQEAEEKTRSVDTNAVPAPVNERMKTFHEQLLLECQRLQLPLDAESIQRKHATDGLGSINQLAAMALSPKTPVGTVTSEELLHTMSNFIDSVLQAALQDIDSPNAVFYLNQAFSATCYVSLPIQSASKGANSTTPTGFSTTITGNGTHSAAVRRFLAQVFLLAALMCVKVYRFPNFLNPTFTKARELAEGDNHLMVLLSKAQQSLGSYSPHSVEVGCPTLGASIPFYDIEDGIQLKSILTKEPLAGAVHVLEDGVSLMGKSEAFQWMLCCAFSPLASGARFLPL
ncbi:hypothetical protein, conserved [Trypanosoma cruzi]|uniref:Uncharacterized protein n=1 Tax=Trypanosoma cruzi (strain CL Brener) TaxID=353153 RepID=Q4DSS0_TRYCC|nr:hypothetical protein, conserved [Trypanosoma cruzi]EAN95573.1 hypothetical protein, conserved [Trypanosoma cruzi]|eukprot:XP_817424.1 hypothetical protein [Trypanosoma cruzi strain CL Brener]